MKVAPRDVTVSDLVSGYEDNGEEGGLRGYNGLLDIRPPYQREFVYDEERRKAVIATVLKGFPLNAMYWAVAGNGFELLDGQQRTLSISQYIDGQFPIVIDGSPRFFSNLSPERKAKILAYKLLVYECEGSHDDKLEWFEVINTVGLELKKQELRNAVFIGPWLTAAKKWFSKQGGPAASIGSRLLTGPVNRQAYLEIALDWLTDGAIDQYMALHQEDQNANELWTFFQNVISWVNLTFPKYRTEMKGVEWGPLYKKFGQEKWNTEELEAEVARLMRDNDVTKKSGIYDYVLSGNERALNIRAFDDNMKREAYERQGGICPVCKDHFQSEEMEGDHIKPWHEGGKTNADNCQMLCKPDNRKKGGK